MGQRRRILDIRTRAGRQLGAFRDPAIRAVTTSTAADLPRAARRRIFLYLGTLVVLISFGAPTGGLVSIPVSFLIKNKLHLGPSAAALYKAAAGAPVGFGFVFGFLRDRWNPFGMRDRGLLLLFGAATALLYVGFAFVPFTGATLFAALLVLTAAFLFVQSAQSGLSSILGQQHVMCGQVSTVWNVFATLPTIAALLAGGHLSGALERLAPGAATRILFLTGAAIMAATALFGAWRPGVVFDTLQAEHAAPTRPREDVARLLRHRAIYPALLISTLWNFAPGSNTALQYYLQDTLHATDAQWGAWSAIFAGAFIPTFLLYGALCRRLALRTQLVWSTVVAVPQMVPLLLMHSATGALIAAAPIGLLGGAATAAYLDLVIRSCPPGLQGTTLMLSATLSAASATFGDLLGTWLYERSGGFTVCVIATTAVYALILPALLLVPRHLTATSDGEAFAAQPAVS
jgi:hypothetical protein